MPRPKHKSRRTDSDSPAAVRPQEQLLLDTLPELSGSNVLCLSAGWGQFAVEFARRHPQSQVRLYFFDVYHQQSTRAAHEPWPENLELDCQPDFLPQPVDLAVVACQRRGDAEWTRDLVQSAADRLQIGGRLVASIDNPDDQWLHTELRTLFRKVTRRPTRTGVVYLVTKTQPLKKLRSFECEFAFRDQGRLLFGKTRPGVFSHRHVDAGARALINTMTVHETTRVLDLGCGSGVVGMAAAARFPGVQVLGVDSNPRAVECTLWGAQRNELPGLTAQLDASGATIPPGQFDLAVANPPYFSNYRIAELFLQMALKGLRPGGQFNLVTKAPSWYEERVPDLFDDGVVFDHKDYFIIQARRPQRVSQDPRSR